MNRQLKISIKALAALLTIAVSFNDVYAMRKMTPEQRKALSDKRKMGTPARNGIGRIPPQNPIDTPDQQAINNQQIRIGVPVIRPIPVVAPHEEPEDPPARIVRNEPVAHPIPVVANPLHEEEIGDHQQEAQNPEAIAIASVWPHIDALNRSAQDQQRVNAINLLARIVEYSYPLIATEDGVNAEVAQRLLTAICNMINQDRYRAITFAIESFVEGNNRQLLDALNELPGRFDMEKRRAILESIYGLLTQRILEAEQAQVQAQRAPSPGNVHGRAQQFERGRDALHTPSPVNSPIPDGAETPVQHHDEDEEFQDGEEESGDELPFADGDEQADDEGLGMAIGEEGDFDDL